MHTAWLKARRATAVALTSVAAVGAFLVAPPVASAVANDAVQGCGATQVVPGVSAIVPAENNQSFFQFVNADRDPVQIVCGDGSTFGAVHIEVKHLVPNWGEAVTAMASTIDRGKAEPDGAATRYNWEFSPGRSIVVVVGDDTVITSFPTDGLEASWTEASVA